MASVRFNIPIDMRTFAGYDLSEQFGGGAIGIGSDTSYYTRTDAGFYHLTTGTGFSGGFVFPGSGTVTGWDFGIIQLQPNPEDPYHPVEARYSYWNFTGLSVPASDFSNAAGSDGATLAAYMPTMLAGNDAINGSDYDDYLLGFDGIDTLNGNAGADWLDGGAGNDTLDGGVGMDTMIGGIGNDTYIVSNSGDKVIEDPSAGTDRVKSSVSVTLAVNVENLTLTGTAAINGTGNGLANQMNGNAAANTLNGGGGNDTLNGGAGADSMFGGTGNDTYFVESLGDTVIENASGGTDLVKSSVTFTLGDNVENLTLTGSAAVHALGNGLANVLVGNSAANTLNGGGGADTMRGGLGNDKYVVENVGDTVIEAAAQGTDQVESSVTFALGDNVENLTLTGSAAINGAGNALANVLIGNSAANRLNGANGADIVDGGAGPDIVNGGLGNDTLIGGSGTDKFRFDTALNSSTNVDKISGFAVPYDTIQLDDDIFTAVGAVGTLSAGAFFVGAAAHDASDRIIYDSATGNIYYDADGNGAGAQVLFAQVAAGLSMTNADFQIIG